MAKVYGLLIVLVPWVGAMAWLCSVSTQLIK